MSTEEHPDHYAFVPTEKKKTMYDEITGEPYEIDDTKMARIKYGEPGYEDAPFVATMAYHPDFLKNLVR
jgi:hypothetical protein